MGNMMGFGVGEWGMGAGLPIQLLAFLPILLVWGIFWKGLGLWHSAQRGEQWWFIAMLFINTLGILEIVYLFGFAKLKMNTLFSNSKKQSTSSA